MLCLPLMDKYVNYMTTYRIPCFSTRFSDLYFGDLFLFFLYVKATYCKHRCVNENLYIPLEPIIICLKQCKHKDRRRIPNMILHVFRTGRELPRWILGNCVFNTTFTSSVCESAPFASSDGVLVDTRRECHFKSRMQCEGLNIVL